MKTTTKQVFEFLQGINTEDNYTANDIAERLGIDVKKVNGAFTMAIQNKKMGFRVDAEVETEEGHKPVKFLKLNDAGKAFDLSSVTVED